MLSIEVRQRIEVGPDEVLALVMDVERYADEVDDKIRPVLWSRREGDRLEFACRPRLAGIRQPKVVQWMRLTPGRRIDIGLLPAPRNLLAHAVAHFEASFECEPVEGGTLLTRRLRFRFTPPARWVLEPWFRRRLPRDVQDEVDRARRHLESG